MVYSHSFSCFILFFCLIFCQLAWGQSSAQMVREGNRLYKQALYDEAAKKYNEALEKRGQEQVSRYNLGNALYKIGKAKEDQDIDGAISHVEQSIADYEQVLKQNVKDEDARFNLDFVKQELERLKKKKKDQEQKDNQQDKSQDKKQDQDKQGQQKQDKEQQKPDQQKQDKQDPSQRQQDQEQQEEKKQDAKQQSSGQEQKEGKNKEDQGQQTKQEVKKGEMSYQEAKSLLEDYQRNDEPKGLLNFIPKDKQPESPVAKDW